ncbi:peroxiredoxin family protein [Pedobacter alpinus]|uniref:Peroxiredoxin family protein n=1 Tax=Pedobacter alpinus TaxID=1590643 RepID=A0ABW5TNU4_9SPHI
MKLKTHALSLFLLTFIFLSACDKPSHQLSTGVWRGALITASGAEIPFNFEVIDSLNAYTIYIINGEERFEVKEISTDGDSIHIKMPLFDSEIKGILKDNKIEGVWTKFLADTNVEMPFYAKTNTNWRISEKLSSSKFNVNGKWATTFITDDGKDTTYAVGEFHQKQAKVTGTFLTSTGDYRYLDGAVSGNKLSLSTFDGSHAFLFTATINPDSTLSDGKFYSGLSYIENFTAKKDSTAKLPDAYGLTFLKNNDEKLHFSFPNLNKEQVSLSDEKFKNKVVILQMFGSWCPNCMDESAYLAKFYSKYKNRGVEILGLAYERTRDFEKSKKNVERMKNRFDMDYDLLITGFTNDKEDAAKSLPMLNKVIAFPTMIILDKKGDVRKIHTGFSGPGTGKHYLEFTQEFEKLIDDMIKE